MQIAAGPSEIASKPPGEDQNTKIWAAQKFLTTGPPHLSTPFPRTRKARDSGLRQRMLVEAQSARRHPKHIKFIKFEMIQKLGIYIMATILSQLYSRMISTFGVVDLNIPLTAVKFYRHSEIIPDSVIANHPSDITLSSC